MIVKFLIVFLLFFLVTPGLFVKVPIKGNHIVVALIHSIIFALLLWLVCNCLKLKEGFSIKTETEKTNKLIDQLKNATTKEEIDNDVAELKSELKRLIAMRNSYLYIGKKHPDHATEFKNDALTLDSVIDKAKTAIADAEAKKTTPAKKPVPAPAPAKKTAPAPAPAQTKKRPSAPAPAQTKKLPSAPSTDRVIQELPYNFSGYKTTFGFTVVTKKLATEVRRVYGRSYNYLMDLPTSTIPDKDFGTNPENNVTINTKTGFKTATDMANAFQAATNYRDLPFTVSAVDNKLQIQFKSSGTQYLRALQVWGQDSVPFKIAKASATIPIPAPVPAQTKKPASGPTQIDLTLSVDCKNVAKDDVAPLKFSSTNLPDDKYTISVSFFYNNNQSRNNIIIQSTPTKLEEISASNKYAKDVFAKKETMIPTSVKPIAYFFAPFTCNSNQFPERDTKGPFIFTLTDSKNKKYYFSMTDTQYMINLSLYANEWQYNNKGTVTLFAEKSIPQLPLAKQIVITPTLPTYPYTPTIPSVSIYNCRGISESYKNTDFYSAITKKQFKGDFIDVCAIYFIFTNNNEFTNFTTNINNSFTKNGTIAFTINNEDQFELINILLPSNKNWEQFLTKNTDNQYTAIGILNTSTPKSIKNIKSPTIKFELKSTPIPLPAPAPAPAPAQYIPHDPSKHPLTPVTHTTSPAETKKPASAPGPSGSSVKPSTSKTSHQPSTISSGSAPSGSSVKPSTSPTSHQPSTISSGPSPAVSEKKNLTLSVYCSSITTPSASIAKTLIAPLKFSSTNLPNDKYSLTVRFQPGATGSGGFGSEIPVPLVPSTGPQELEKMEITSQYTAMVGTVDNNKIPPSEMNKAKFLSMFICLGGGATSYRNNVYPFAKGPFIFTLTNSSNKSYVFELSNADYINLGNDINTSQRGNKGSLTLTEMAETKAPLQDSSFSIITKYVFIGGTYSYNSQAVYPVIFYMNNESQQNELYQKLQSKLQSGSLTFTLPVTFPNYKNQKFQINQLVPTTDSMYGTFTQGMSNAVVGLLNSKAGNQENTSKPTKVIFDPTS